MHGVTTLEGMVCIIRVKMELPQVLYEHLSLSILFLLLARSHLCYFLTGVTYDDDAAETHRRNGRLVPQLLLSSTMPSSGAVPSLR